jgi:hypothetical protein
MWFRTLATWLAAHVVGLSSAPGNETKQNKTKQNKTKQNKTKQNKTKQNKTKQNKTKQNKKGGPADLVSTTCSARQTARGSALAWRWPVVVQIKPAWCGVCSKL